MLIFKESVTSNHIFGCRFSALPYYDKCAENGIVMQALNTAVLQCLRFTYRWRYISPTSADLSLVLHWGMVMFSNEHPARP